jgi:hypothetical protein
MNNTWLKTIVPAIAVLALCADVATAAEEHGMDMGAKMGSGQQCRGRMKEMLDTDKDGKVSKAEFAKHHEDMFNRMDKNGDGMLDDTEMQHAKGEMHKRKHGRKHD